MRQRYSLPPLGHQTAVLLAGVVLALLALSPLASPAARAADAAEAAQKPPLTVGIFLSSRNDVCFDPGDVGAIKRMAGMEAERINAAGGIAGRKLNIEYYDDQRDAARAIGNLRTALADPSSLAFIGMSNAERSKGAFEALSDQLKGSQIPFLSDISVSKIFADFPNVYTTRASQDDERMPVLAQFLKSKKPQRTAFLGAKGTLVSETLGDGLAQALGPNGLVLDRRFQITDDKISPDELDAVIAELKAKAPDLIFLSVGGNRNPQVIAKLAAAGITPPLFLSGRISSLPEEILKSYPADLYQLAFDRLPGVFSDRMRKRMSASGKAKFMFEGAKIAAAPGWTSGECKARPDDAEPEVLGDANMRAVGIGAQFADMVALVADAARGARSGLNMGELRSHVLEHLQRNYATGQGMYQGSFDNWSFNPKTRAASRTPFIVWRPAGATNPQLAPEQYVRLRNDAYRTIETLYVDVDLIRAFRIDDNEKSFFAEFYLSMRDDGKGTSIKNIEFANAFLDPRTNDRQITVRTLNNGGKSEAYPDDIKIYQVAGKFMFEPTFANYPFDAQRFSIDVRPSSGDVQFIVQPPPADLRDMAAETDGWDLQEQYVGSDEDFVPSIDARTNARSVVPLYKASFVWQMSRQATDYYLRVMVPLGFILIVAYLSIFISRDHFEAIVTIQVTALLSAVALYLALPQLAADSTTLSDRIFLFSYLALSLMIGLSIMRMNGAVSQRLWLSDLLRVAHLLLIPVLVAVMAYYVHQATGQAFI